MLRKKLLLFILLIVGCYHLIEYNPKFNKDINALHPYKDCRFDCTDSSDVHCHWGNRIYSEDVNHEWTKDKCNYDLCICMLECINENYIPIILYYNCAVDIWCGTHFR